VTLVALVQGTLGQSSVAIRCETSDASLLKLTCPSQSASGASTSASCDLQLPIAPSLSARGIAFAAVAMEDYDNAGPAVRNLRLWCMAARGSSSALFVRSTSVIFEVTNVVLPIFSEAFFADGGNKSETRRVLSGGAFWHSLQRLSAVDRFCANSSYRVDAQQLVLMQAEVASTLSRLAEECSRSTPTSTLLRIHSLRRRRRSWCAAQSPAVRRLH
jgi:hypothetical protein